MMAGVNQVLKLNELYRHYKTGGVYMPVQLVKNTSDGEGDEHMVLYYSFEARDFFVRKMTEFVERVKHPKYDDRWVFRFEWIVGGEVKT